MKISQRSLRYSLVWHLSLVLVGTVFWALSPWDPPSVAALPSLRAVTVTPVNLAPDPPVVSPQPAPSGVAPSSPPQRSRTPRRPSPPRPSAQAPRTAQPGAVALPASEPRRPRPNWAPAPRYPQVAAPPASAGPLGPSSSATPRRRPGAAGPSAPLWQPEESPEPSEPSELSALATATATAEPAPATPAASPAAGAGQVVAAALQGRPRLQSPAFLALLSGYLEAEFRIAPDGSTQVRLLVSTGDPLADQQALQELRRWRWSPRTVDGVPVEDLQVLEFTVEQ